jgi:hypothetical protein
MLPLMTTMAVRAAVVAAVLLAGGCAGKSPEAARPAASTSPSSPPPVNAEPTPPPAVAAEPAPGAAAAEKPSARPVGTKLMQDAADSPKEFKLHANDGTGHGLGKGALTVDGQNVWPPQGPGCPELVRCCNELVTLDESLALACMLAVGRDPDCSTALRTSVAIAGESGVSPPAACPR